VSLCDAELRKVWSFFATGDELTAYFEWLEDRQFPACREPFAERRMLPRRQPPLTRF